MSQAPTRHGPREPAVRSQSAIRIAAAPADHALLLRFAERMRTPLIIEPEQPALSPGSLARGLVTLACWSLWVHFLMPLLTLLAWMSGWRRLSTELLTPECLQVLVRHLPVYLAVLGLICGGLIAWALFNWWRFADRERRQGSRPVTHEQLARGLDLPAEDLRTWQASRRLVVRHNDQGLPCGVDDFSM
jgi:poly-beta-1,6-N-acetyl-D-glucosamine biosynthesis protein PgaD